MMKHAVIETGGKQYVVKPGDVFSIEKFPGAKEGKKTVFDKVLLYTDGADIKIGDPYVKGISVGATILLVGRGKKITVLKYKPKVRYKIKCGHRQHFVKVQIDGGEGEKKKSSTKGKKII